MEMTDKTCVERCRDGHPDDFSLLVERYQKPLFAYVARRLGDPLEAEEAVQESFVRAFVSLKALRKPESFHSWLVGIAARILKEQFRSDQRRQRDQQFADLVLEPKPAGPSGIFLEEAIAALPETYRQVILLRYYEGLSCQELATRLEMPLGTVTKTLSRAYALLRQELRSRDCAEVPCNFKSSL